MYDKTIKTKIVKSLVHDPWYNLALEEFFLNSIKPNEIILYLWQNDNTIVVGKNQNPWRECDCNLFNKEGGKVARRLSGGGTVFHDLGNLNFTFLMDKNLYDFKKQIGVIVDAVNKLGVEAEFSGRNDVVYNGRKFSGNAFYFDKDTCYHHGTILVDSDIYKLSKYLTVSKEKIMSKGVESVPSRVINLIDINKDITVKNVEEEVIKSFIDIYGNSNIYNMEGTKDIDEINLLYKKYSSWQWIYGETPDFDISFNKRFNWGTIELCFKLNGGSITDTLIYSDAMDIHFIDFLKNNLKDVKFDRSSIEKKLSVMGLDENISNMINDIKEWLKEKIV